MRSILRLRNRPGATLAVVAVSIIALLAVMSLAIDLGMMYSARNEAQRVADAAALAGASVFMGSPPFTVAEAEQRATEYVTQNSILTSVVDAAEAEINVDLARERVEVIVRRGQIPTWFARVFGVKTVGVVARAVAEAAAAGAAKCVRPWAVQDLWLEGSTGQRPLEGDKFDPSTGDTYVPTTHLGDMNGTGYGRSSDDHGAQIVLKTQRPAGGNDTELAQPGPGEFMIWQMPEDPNMEQCATGGGQMGQYKNAICACNQNSIELDKDYPLRTGNVVGPTDQGLTGLVNKDPDAYWVEGKWENGVWQPGHVESVHGNASPRVVKIALMAPLPPPPNGAQNYNHSNLSTVRFTNFAMMFVENHRTLSGQGGQQAEITGRFMYFAPGEAGPTSATIPKYLRLVE